MIKRFQFALAGFLCGMIVQSCGKPPGPQNDTNRLPIAGSAYFQALSKKFREARASG